MGRCLLGLHKYGFFKARRLDEKNSLRPWMRSIVYHFRCQRCGRMMT